MAQISDFNTYRNGMIEFTVSEAEFDGRYSIEPMWVSCPTTRDGQLLTPVAAEVTAVRQYLDEWFRSQLSEDAIAALAELDSLRERRNLPERLDAVELLRRVRSVIEQLGAAAELFRSVYGCDKDL